MALLKQGLQLTVLQLLFLGFVLMHVSFEPVYGLDCYDCWDVHPGVCNAKNQGKVRHCNVNFTDPQCIKMIPQASKGEMVMRKCEDKVNIPKDAKCGKFVKAYNTDGNICLCNDQNGCNGDKPMSAVDDESGSGNIRPPSGDNLVIGLVLLFILRRITVGQAEY